MLFRSVHCSVHTLNQLGASAKLATRHAFIENALGDQPYLTGENFTVADAYLYVTLSWRERVGVDISGLPRLSAYFERCRARPSVQQARKAEGLPL